MASDDLAAAYRRGRRDAVREIVARLRWDADVAASGPGRFGELSARLGACADWIEREFGAAGFEALREIVEEVSGVRS